MYMYGIYGIYDNDNYDCNNIIIIGAMLAGVSDGRACVLFVSDARASAPCCVALWPYLRASLAGREVCSIQTYVYSSLNL